MLRFHSDDPGDTPFKLKRAVKDSGLTLQQNCDRLEAEYGVSITTSALSHSISRDTIRLQMALQLLAICGVTEIKIRGSE
jgi:hypothetical protein